MGKKTSDNKALPDKKNYLNTLYQENEIKRKKNLEADKQKHNKTSSRMLAKAKAENKKK